MPNVGHYWIIALQVGVRAIITAFCNSSRSLDHAFVHTDSLTLRDQGSQGAVAEEVAGSHSVKNAQSTLYGSSASYNTQLRQSQAIGQYRFLPHAAK
jgi:hypothetical protein